MHIVLNLAQMPKLWQVLHAPNTKQGNQIALKVEHTNMKQAFQTFNKKHLHFNPTANYFIFYIILVKKKQNIYV